MQIYEVTKDVLNLIDSEELGQCLDCRLVFSMKCYQLHEGFCPRCKSPDLMIGGLDGNPED